MVTAHCRPVLYKKKNGKLRIIKYLGRIEFQVVVPSNLKCRAPKFLFGQKERQQSFIYLYLYLHANFCSGHHCFFERIFNDRF